MMNEDEVLDAVKQTLSDVRMDRPVEAIERRGRERRRNRRLFGVAAGGGLAAVAALALALPTAASQPGATPTDAGPAAGSSTAEMEPAAFTLARQADSTVKLTLNYKQLLDPAALKGALADAGVPAEVKTHAICTPEGKELPQADQVYRNKRVDWPDGSPKQYDVVIAPANMPKNSRLYFSVFSVRPGEEYAKIANYLVSNDDPMQCRSDK
ncbi:hypothetical protein E1211_14910 [Micromonospora sp. 15K316]|uniref:hypothetical protein n=1 Tax=Micromonospora sp. 15K316 TaxID=2530376 RepID=UPI001048EC5E|nr:hypothetical protein [Micromonospora sp. 15K316]TDC35934.1 hypothetical protein E1211_14910 [Micromonospora sp. 15K316]